MYRQIGGILNKIECKLLAAGGYSDHIHLLSSVDRKLSIPEYVSRVKSGSFFWIHENIPEKKLFAWQNGHHQHLNFQDELKDLLSRHKLKYDKRYLWN